jgi:hypothetical protein
MPYGQFVQEDTLIGVRTAAAIRPFTQEAGVIDQVAMAAPTADQRRVRPFHGTAPQGSLHPPRRSGSASVPSSSSSPPGCHSRGNRRPRRETARRAPSSRDRRRRARQSRPSSCRERRPAPDRRNTAATGSAAPRRHRTPDRGFRRRNGRRGRVRPSYTHLTSARWPAAASPIRRRHCGRQIDRRVGTGRPH